MLSKDEVKGKAEQAKGKVKEKAGEWTGNEELEAEGVEDQVVGTVREEVGKTKRQVKEVADELADEARKP